MPNQKHNPTPSPSKNPTHTFQKAILDEISYYLKRIETVFNVDELLNKVPTEREILEYYIQSEKGYHFIHSKSGSIHLPLQFADNPHKSGHLAQAYMIEEYMKKIKPKNVLELGVGKGFNIKYLASKYPDVTFWGIDLTPIHVEIAVRKTRHLDNVYIGRANFNNLPYEENLFDIVYSIESFCHTTNLERSFKQVYAVLKRGGYFIVFDGYRVMPIRKLPPSLTTATKLVERSMAVPEVYELNGWIELAQSIGFKISEIEDFTEAILPAWQRFYRLSKIFFNTPFLATLLKKIISTKLLQNSIAGILTPLTVKAGIHGYYKVVLKK